MTEIRVLWQAVKSTYRERREQGDEPIQASITAFEAYRDLMKQKTNWILVIVGSLIIGGVIFAYRWHFGHHLSSPEL